MEGIYHQGNSQGLAKIAEKGQGTLPGNGMDAVHPARMRYGAVAG